MTTEAASSSAISIHETRELALKMFKKLGKVVEIGIGKRNSKPVIRVVLREKLATKGPSEINGIPVELVVLGKNLMV